MHHIRRHGGWHRRDIEHAVQPGRGSHLRRSEHFHDDRYVIADIRRKVNAVGTPVDTPIDTETGTDTKTADG
jgi:hypothetical protein